jgi:glycosyltransferase involved in cell wall biosynthesis
VIITTYNQARYISAAIQSAIDQDFVDREIIVVDDGSTDDTPARVAAFGQRVVSIRQRNQGVAGSRNTGIRQARGELLAFLDGDDLWEPRQLSRQVSAARDHPLSGLIVAGGVQFDDEGTILRPSLLAPAITALLGSSQSITLCCYEQLLTQNLILTSSQVLIPRAVLNQVGLSDRRIGPASDWDLYLRIAARYEVTFLREALTRWRYLPTSVSGPEHLRTMRWAADEIGVLRKQLREAGAKYRPIIGTLLKKRTFERAYTLYSYGMETDRAFARGQLLRMLRRYPTSEMVLAFLVALHLPRRLNRRVGSIARRLLNQSTATRIEGPPPPIDG